MIIDDGSYLFTELLHGSTTANKLWMAAIIAPARLAPLRLQPWGLWMMFAIFGVPSRNLT